MSGKVKELLEDERVKVLMSIMGDRYLYDIVCALRGPDIKNAVFAKEVLTKTIRGIAMYPDEVEDVVKVHMDPGDVELLLMELGELKGDFAHYFTHINDAFHALHRLGIIDDDTFKYINTVLTAVDEAFQELEDTGEISDNTIDELVEEVEKAFEKWVEVKGIE